MSVLALVAVALCVLAVLLMFAVAAWKRQRSENDVLARRLDVEAEIAVVTVRALQAMREAARDRLRAWPPQ